jgi:tripartite ATP-independent transporter DctM subunit
MSVEVIAIIMVFSFLLLALLGVPIAFALSSLGLFFGLYMIGPSCMPLFINRIYGIMENGTFPAIPLFMFMGFMLEKSGSAEKLYRVLYQLLGNTKGGLAYTTIIISTLFAACSGVIAASIVTMGLIALPAMLERGYDKSLACGSVMAGGTLGVLIPPSIVLILLGPIAGVSVGKLFAGAMLPGLFLSLIFLIYIFATTIIHPHYGPSISKEERSKIDKKRLILEVVYHFIPPISLILMVLGGILFGFTATTEAAAVGAFGSFILAIIYKRKLDLELFKEASLETIKLSAMVLFVAIGASLFTVVFITLGGSEYLTGLVMSMPGGKWGALAFMNIVVFVLGMFIDWIGILYLCVPVFIPIGIKLGFDPLWLSIVISVNLQMSFLSPPFAYSIFFLKSVAPKVEMSFIYYGAFQFLVLQAAGVVMTIIFPQLALWLPAVLFP